ncbi:sensor histidine kinase [Cohnella sp. WQ 127256]|uniref:sensor histidine kinase n=1 Tax=Cohnella sp. WQ 127256 TaxID=2938790 RepID=UPI0021185E1F|nr:sensor histidine kinase [Cohnella sp. WQ 127256]
MARGILGKRSIFVKILTWFLIIICMCITTTITIAYYQIDRVIENKVSLSNRQLVSKTLENIDYYLLDIMELSKNIAVDDQILNSVRELQQQSQSSVSSTTSFPLDGSMKKYQYLKSYITDISAFNAQELTYYTQNYDYKKSIFNESWYAIYNELASDSYFSEVHPSVIHGTSLDGIQTFTYFKKIYDIADPTRYMYTLAIELDLRVMTNAIKQLGSDEQWSTLVMNENKAVILNPQNERLNSNDGLSQPRILAQKDTSEILHMAGTDYLVIGYTSPTSHWKIVSAAPYKQLMKSIEPIRNYLIAAGVGCALIASVIAFVLSRRLTVPLGKLMRAIQEIERGNFDMTIDIRSGDEMERLGKVLNRMTYNIKNLLNDNIRKEKLKRKAELTALQAQINPHFLYNTLESINWLAVRKKEPEISTVLTNLGKFFRISLSNGSPFILLGKEIEHILSYINIQKFRYSNNFETEVHVDTETKGLYVPKLILQPIVENALIHGLRNKESPGRIILRADKFDNMLTITVKDNGSGLAPDTLKQIQGKLAGIPITAEKEGGYGLLNIHDRIQLSFGPNYGLSIDSIPEQGTCITLLLPLIPTQPEELD